MKTTTTILIVEDDPAIRRGVVDVLRGTGYRVLEAGDGAAGERLALAGDSASPDLILLDVLLPGRDGFSILEAIRREKAHVPVIMLTARGSEADRVKGLRSGADDYVVKPFSASELLARVEAVLRRSPARGRRVIRLILADVCVDLGRAEFQSPGRGMVALTDRETAILEHLAVNRDRVVERSELLERVWGLDPRGIHTRTVDMHIARLREKLGDHGEGSSRASIIRTVRGRGYTLGETVVCEVDS